MCCCLLQIQYFWCSSASPSFYNSPMHNFSMASPKSKTYGGMICRQDYWLLCFQVQLRTWSRPPHLRMSSTSSHPNCFLTGKKFCLFLQMFLGIPYPQFFCCLNLQQISFPLSLFPIFGCTYIPKKPCDTHCHSEQLLPFTESWHIHHCSNSKFRFGC